MEGDAIRARIGEAVSLGYAGDRDRARADLDALWDEIHASGEAIGRCMLAHYMADLQADPRTELLWDLRALEAAGSVSGEAAREFFPSLYLNLAEDYRKLGEWRAAREHLRRATELAHVLPLTGYAKMIRRGIAGVAAQLPEEPD
jgi:tetratricopeptide (TPR) repeat protein